MKRSTIFFLFVLSLVLVASVAAQMTGAESSTGNDAPPPFHYNVVGLGVFNENVLSPYSFATGLNDFGEVIGHSSFEDIPQYQPGNIFTNTHAFVWYAGRLHDVDASMEFPNDPYSEPGPQGINDLGQIIGHYNGPSGCCGSFVAPPGFNRWAFIWHKGNTQLLTGLDFVIAINNLGQVLGSDDQGNPLLWQNGQVTTLLGLSSGNDINDLGQIAGWVSVVGSDGATHFHAALWRNGTVKDLGTLGGSDSMATGINIWGQVVGSSEIACTTNSSNVCTHAFLWQNDLMRDLGTLPGYEDSWPVGINARGQIVGLSSGPASCEPTCPNCAPPPCPPGAVLHAFLWERREMYDLAELVPANSGWELVFVPNFGKGGEGGYLGPTGINNLGQISGNGSVAGQTGPRAYLLTPALQ
jgi:probable HAF family extracellular repeat protein